MRNLPEKPTGQDRMFQAAHAAVSAVPRGDGPLQVLVENIFTAPLEQRRARWFKELHHVIVQIQERVDSFDPETLSSNDSFITAAMQASQIPMRNHHEERLKVLRNAALNSGLPNPPSEQVQSVFIYLVDRLTPWHLRMLSLLDDPARWLRKHQKDRQSFNGGAVHLVEYCFPQLSEEKELWRQIAKDLQSSGLLTEGSYMNAMMTNDGVMLPRSTQFGHKFICFILEPVDA